MNPAGPGPPGPGSAEVPCGDDPVVLPGLPRVLVVLHGHGDDPAALVPRRNELDPHGRWTVVVPTGPVRLADGSPAWFDEGDAADVARLRHAVTGAIGAGAAAAGAAPEDVVVVGWSQGGAVALALAAWPEGPTVAAVAAVAGWLPGFEGVTWAARPGLPVLVVHGEDDEVVPLPMGRSAARHLERSGAEVALRLHPVGHQLTTDMLADVARWLDGQAQVGAAT